MTECGLIAGLLATTMGVCAGAVAGQTGTTGSVTGKVVQDRDEQGIRKVIVQLVAGEGGEAGKEYRTATDVSGVFRLEGVEAGKYSVELTRPGFFPEKKRGQEWTITLEAGQQLTDLTYKMQAAGVIAGRIVDADGDPLGNVGVRAVRQGKAGTASVRHSQGITVIGESMMDGPLTNQAITNDLGEYRIANLQPGEYEVEAEPPVFVEPAPNPTDKGRQRDKVLFTKTYYPGAMEEGQAGLVQVVSGGTATANVTLQTNRAYRVSGTVNGGGGAQVEQIVLVSAGGTQLQENVEEGGKFEFQNVQPGTYEARVLLVTGVAEGRPPTMKVELVRAPLVVESADVTGLDLVPEAGGTVKGRFRAEDDAQIDWTQLQVRLEPAPEGAGSGARSPVDALGAQFDPVEVAADGTFEIPDAPGGSYQLGISMKSEIYRDLYLKSVKESGREVVDTGFAVTGGAELEVVVSTKGATIEGTVLDAEGKPATNAEVMAVPAAGQKMRPDAYQVDKTNAQGQYTLRGMNPGPYVVVALEGVHEDVRSAAFATKYGMVGEAVELSEGEKKTVELKVVEAKE